jgi:hypothetical protein
MSYSLPVFEQLSNLGFFYKDGIHLGIVAFKVFMQVYILVNIAGIRTSHKAFQLSNLFKQSSTRTFD